MSKNDTWMPLYIGDYVADTGHLTTVQHGAYLLLLMHYWRSGPLPNDQNQLAAIARAFDQRSWRSIWPVVSRFFTMNGDGHLHQKRMDQERNRVMSISDVRTESGSEGGRRRWRADDGAELRKQATRSQRLAEARKKGTHTDEEWESLLDICERRCVRCGTETIGNPVKDHIHPIYRGGSDSIENIQPLCRNCNSSKGPETTDFRPRGWRDKMPSKTSSKMPSECQPNAYQDASQDGSQNAFKTPTELQSEKERLSFFGMVRGDARASPPGEGPEIATVGPQAVESVVAFTAKANNSRGKYPTEKRPVRDRWDQVNEVGEKPKIRASHLTREQINQSLAKQRA